MQVLITAAKQRSISKPIPKAVHMSIYVISSFANFPFEPPPRFWKFSDVNSATKINKIPIKESRGLGQKIPAKEQESFFMPENLRNHCNRF